MSVFKLCSATGTAKYLTKNCNVKRMWTWLNIVFNAVDKERLELYGPDRVCAEWLLRNGAAVKWTTAREFLTDYNGLPLETLMKKLYIKEVDATESSINDYGFAHFVGCKYIETIVLHNCMHIENGAMEKLLPLKKTLRFLRVSSCGNVTDEGLNAICLLTNLEKLILGGDLAWTKKEAVISNLNAHLPKCHITLV